MGEDDRGALVESYTPTFWQVRRNQRDEVGPRYNLLHLFEELSPVRPLHGNIGLVRLCGCVRSPLDLVLFVHLALTTACSSNQGARENITADGAAALQRDRPVNPERSRRGSVAALEASQRAFETAGSRPEAVLGLADLAAEEQSLMSDVLLRLAHQPAIGKPQLSLFSICSMFLAAVRRYDAWRSKS